MNLINYYPVCEHLLQGNRREDNLMVIMDPEELNRTFNLKSEDDATITYNKYDISTLKIDITYTPYFIMKMKNGRLLTTFLATSLLTLLIGSWFFPKKLGWVNDNIRFIGMFF